MRKILIAIFLLSTFVMADNGKNSKFNLNLGLFTNNETTIVLAIEPNYDWAVFRIEGMSSYKAHDDEWLDVRGTLAYRFFADLPYFFETGFSVGYLYARAPNEFHKSFNEANKHYYLWDYNLREYLDYSLSASANIYGFQANIYVPIFYSHNTVKPRPLWSLGYIFNIF